MKDRYMGMALSTAIAAPLIIICCGGKLALIGIAFGGVTGFLTGGSILAITLFALLGGILFLAVREIFRARNSDDPERETKKEGQIDRQTP